MNVTSPEGAPKSPFTREKISYWLNKLTRLAKRQPELEVVVPEVTKALNNDEIQSQNPVELKEDLQKARTALRFLVQLMFNKDLDNPPPKP